MLNFSTEMIPGISCMVCGVILAFGGARLCHREKDVHIIKILGVVLCAVGAILVFFP